MSRYLERAEHTARLLDVELQLWLDQSPEVGAGRWRFLVDALQVTNVQGRLDPLRVQPRERFFDCFVHVCSAGKSSPRARAVQLRDVGAAEQTILASD
jgi:uncharacterized alpha-E superfamily protein